MEAGRQGIEMTQLMKIAEVLEVRTGDLFDGAVPRKVKGEPVVQETRADKWVRLLKGEKVEFEKEPTYFLPMDHDQIRSKITNPLDSVEFSRPWFEHDSAVVTFMADPKSHGLTLKVYPKDGTFTIVNSWGANANNLVNLAGAYSRAAEFVTSLGLTPA